MPPLSDTDPASLLRHHGCIPSGVIVQKWFKDALGSQKELPTVDVCWDLGRKFQVAANKASYERIFLLCEMTVAQHEQLIFSKFMDATIKLRSEIQQLGSNWDEHSFPCYARGIDGCITPREIYDLLGFISILASPRDKRQNRHVEYWHVAGREIATAVACTLRE